MIDYALERVKQLTIIICQTEKYKIPVEIRAAWIRELYPQVDLKILNHDPSLDSVSTTISKKWADLTIKFLGFAPDVVFSSEKYGETYAYHMGCKHIMVDEKRINFHISGTEIRKNCFKYWEYLPAPVRAYYAKRIVVLGAESTGTTTLARDLSKYYQTAWVPEYGRFYYEGKMNSKANHSWTSDEFFHIAGKQNEMEEALAKQCDKIIICDTDALATTIWHKRYVGYKSKDLEKLVNTKNHALYILTNTDIPFKQDGTRDGQHLREWMNQLFLDELKSRKLNYIVVRGDKKTRLNRAVKEIDSLLKLD